MPSNGYSVTNVFAAQTGPIPLSQLDADFTQAANKLNNLTTPANYFVDSSGAPNVITVTVPAPLIFSYVAGMPLQVLLANTTTATAVNVNVNGLGNQLILNNDGTAPSIGSLVAGMILNLQYDGTRFRLTSQSGVLGTGLFADGTVGAPSISFSSDTDTGIRRASSNNMRFVTGGADRLILDAVGICTFNAANSGSPTMQITGATGSVDALRIIGGTVGSPAIRISNSDNTGATAASFVAANKPGAGTTVGTWLAINLGGTLFWIPCWVN